LLRKCRETDPLTNHRSGRDQGLKRQLLGTKKIPARARGEGAWDRGYESKGHLSGSSPKQKTRNKKCPPRRICKKVKWSSREQKEGGRGHPREEVIRGGVIQHNGGERTKGKKAPENQRNGTERRSRDERILRGGSAKRRKPGNQWTEHPRKVARRR